MWYALIAKRSQKLVLGKTPAGKYAWYSTNMREIPAVSHKTPMEAFKNAKLYGKGLAPIEYAAVKREYIARGR